MGLTDKTIGYTAFSNSIAAIKAARRAELANAEATRLAAESEQARRRDEGFNQALVSHLQAQDLAWLLFFRADQECTESILGRAIRSARFDLRKLGHRPIRLRLVHVDSHGPGAWQTVGEFSDNEASTWIVDVELHELVNSTKHWGHELFADALLAAELPAAGPLAIDPTESDPADALVHIATVRAFEIGSEA